MDVMCENREYRDYFKDVQGFYREQEKPEEVIPIARRIKDLRARHNLSLEQFSWIVGIDVDRLAAIEERRVLPDVAAIVKMDDAGLLLLRGRDAPLAPAWSGGRRLLALSATDRTARYRPPCRPTRQGSGSHGMARSRAPSSCAGHPGAHSRPSA